MKKESAHSPREVIARSLEIGIRDPEKALTVLAEAVDAALQSGNQGSVLVLSRHAGVVSMAAGRAREAFGYFVKVVRCAPQDPYAYVALAEACVALRRRDSARCMLQRAMSLATVQEDSEATDLVECEIARLNGGSPPKNS